MTRWLCTVLALACTACGGPLYEVYTPSAPASDASTTVVARATDGSTLPGDEDSVKFAVIGDAGTGGIAQYQIAERMAEARARFPYDFVIMLGDNMYGSEGPRDYLNKFERPYKPLLDADVKFYAALGNHDEPSQCFYKPFNMDGDRFYTFTKGDVEFFVLDSTYMSPQQIAWLKKALERSDAKWKIPYMHHPIYSSGERHGSETDLRVLIEPLFVQHGVDVVFAGHEHVYERLKPQQGIAYITEGASAKLRAGNIRVGSSLTAKGFDTDHSFMLVEILKDQMFFETISRRGRIVDSGIITRREVTTPATQ